MVNKEVNAPIRAAAIIVLLLSMIAFIVLAVNFYQNTVMLKSVNETLDCMQIHGPDYDCQSPSMLAQYGIPGGISIFAFISSLVLFGASKPK